VEETRALKALRDALNGACPFCMGTAIDVGLYGPAACTRCLQSDAQIIPAARRLADYVWAHVKTVDETTLYAARLLTHATAEVPFPGPMLRSFLRLSERELKKTIETIRAEWRLPLISQRQNGGGYWYAESAEQFLDWFRQMRGQAVRELATAHGMMRANYPALAGQGDLDFITSFTEELREALR
jgi:hypothetical protein